VRDFNVHQIQVTVLTVPTGRWQPLTKAIATEPFVFMLSAIFSSDVSKLTHRRLELTYFELVQRYKKFFEIHPQFLPPIIATFMDQRGNRLDTARTFVVHAHAILVRHAQP
jgi:hypothetical protein